MGGIARKVLIEKYSASIGLAQYYKVMTEKH
jgi:hypothetical protein